MASQAPSTGEEELVLSLSPEGGLFVDAVRPCTDLRAPAPGPGPAQSTSLFAALREMCPQSSTLVAAMDVCDAQATQYLHTCTTSDSSSRRLGLTWDDAMALLVYGRCLADAALAAGLCAGRGTRLLARVAQAAAKLPRVRGTYYRGLGPDGGAGAGTSTVPRAGCRVRWPCAVPVVADYMAAHDAYRAHPFAQLLVLDGVAARCLPPALAAAVPVPFALLDPDTVLVATEVVPRLQLATLTVPSRAPARPTAAARADEGPSPQPQPQPPLPKRTRTDSAHSLFAPSTSVFQAAAGSEAQKEAPEEAAPEAAQEAPSPPRKQGSEAAPAFLPLDPVSPEERAESPDAAEDGPGPGAHGLPLAHEELLITGKALRALAAQLGVSAAAASRLVETSFRGHALAPRGPAAPDVFTFPLPRPGHAPPVRGVVQRAHQASWAFNTLVPAGPAQAPGTPFRGPHPASAAAIALPDALCRRIAARLEVAPETCRARVHAAYARACARHQVCACPGAYLDFPLDAPRGLRLTLSPPHTLWKFLGTE